MLLIPFMLYNKKRTERKLQMEKEQLRDNRKKDYYRDVFFNDNVQFEVKLNNIGSYFIGKYKETWQKLYKINKTEDIKHNIINTLIMIINVSSEFLVLTVSVSQLQQTDIKAVIQDTAVEPIYPSRICVQPI